MTHVVCTKGCPGRDSMGPALCPETAEEAVFASVIASLKPPRDAVICTWIRDLDALVQSGKVRRTFAAASASMAGAMETDWGGGILYKVTFLYRLLGQRHQKETTPCDCLLKVLEWGTCPHVGYMFARDGQQVGMVFTPMMHAMSHPHTWRVLLAKYGCPPWTRLVIDSEGWRPALPKLVPHVWNRVLHPLQVQWGHAARWDRRSGRRRWIQLIV
jgi:hypothetical protein